MFETMLLALNWRNRINFAPAGEGDGGGSDDAGNGDGGDNSGGAEGSNDAGGGDGGENNSGTNDAADGGGTNDNGDVDYDLPFAEGFDLSDEAVTEYTNLLREQGIAPEQAKALVEFENQLFEQHQTAQADRVQELSQAVEQDEYLSQDWDVTGQRVQAGLKAAGADQEAIDALPDDVKVNPVIMKAFAMLGESVGSDSFDRGGAADGAADPASAWYGETTPETKRK